MISGSSAVSTGRTLRFTTCRRGRVPLGSAGVRIGVRSSSRRPVDPRGISRCRSRSGRPTTSSSLRSPSEARISRTSIARCVKKWTAISAVPSNLARHFGSLRGDAGRAGVQVALAGHVAADGDHGRRPEAELLGARASPPSRRRGRSCRPPSVRTVIRPRRSFITSTCWVSARPSSHGRAGVLDRRERRGAGSAVVAADQDVVGVRLGDARRDRCRRRPRPPA